MIKGTPELISGRREEIVNACEKLYKTMNFKEITLKEIGNEVPFSRPTIYNYFQTKEEIFLALYTREYDLWIADLEKIASSDAPLSRKDVAGRIAKSLEPRVQLLKLLSMNNYDMEANSRPELLVSFKASYGRSLEVFRGILEKFCPGTDENRRTEIVYVFFPFMFGLYPYSAVTEKQRSAMEEAGVGFVEHSVYELAYSCLCALLGA